jgi:hypothetical protein
MAIFTVHTPAGAPAAAEKAVFLRDGFSVPAFFFGPLWLAWNRAFLAAAGWTALLLLVGFGGAKLGASQEALSLVNIAFGLALGFEGPRLIAWTLARRGFNESAVVAADNDEEAEEVFFHNRRISAPPPPSPPAAQVLGVTGERRI